MDNKVKSTALIILLILPTGKPQASILYYRLWNFNKCLQYHPCLFVSLDIKDVSDISIIKFSSRKCIQNESRIDFYQLGYRHVWIFYYLLISKFRAYHYCTFQCKSCFFRICFSMFSCLLNHNRDVLFDTANWELHKIPPSNFYLL